MFLIVNDFLTGHITSLSSKTLTQIFSPDKSTVANTTGLKMYSTNSQILYKHSQILSQSNKTYFNSRDNSNSFKYLNNFLCLLTSTMRFSLKWSSMISLLIKLSTSYCSTYVNNLYT